MGKEISRSEIRERTKLNSEVRSVFPVCQRKSSVMLLIVNFIGAKESPGNRGRQPGGLGWSRNFDRVLEGGCEGIGLVSSIFVRSLRDFFGCLYFIVYIIRAFYLVFKGFTMRN